MYERMKYFVIAAVLGAVSACSGVSSPMTDVSVVPRETRTHTRIANTTIQYLFALAAVPATSQAARNVHRLRISFPGNRRPAEIVIAGAVCTTCSAALEVPVKVSAFAFDALDKSGKLLSHTSIPSYAMDGIIVNLSLASTVGSVGIGSSDERPAFGSKAVSTLNVWARTGEPSNGFIVGPGAYTPAVKLSLSTQLNGMHLSRTEVRSAGDTPPTIAYPGGLQSALVTVRSGASSASTLVAPVVPVTNVSLPSIAKNAIVAAAGDYVWANLGYSVERLDVVHGSNRVTTLPAGVDEAGALTGTADGALWYSGCQTLGPVATGGVGFISAAGAARFFASALMPLLVCPNLALAPDGNIWFSNELQLAKMTPAGSFAAVKVHPRRTDQTGLSNIVFANDGTMWMISGRPDNAGSLIHIAQSGSVLGAYGHEKFLTVATDSSSRLYTIGWTAISVYNLSGVLQSTYTPQGGTLQKTVQTVTRDGALWFGIGYDSFRTNALVGRIAPDGSMFEFSIQADGGTMPALAATGDGSVWFPGSSSAKMYRINLSTR